MDDVFMFDTRNPHVTVADMQNILLHRDAIGLNLWHGE